MHESPLSTPSLFRIDSQATIPAPPRSLPGERVRLDPGLEEALSEVLGAHDHFCSRFGAEISLRSPCIANELHLGAREFERLLDTLLAAEPQLERFLSDSLPVGTETFEIFVQLVEGGDGLSVGEALERLGRDSDFERLLDQSELMIAKDAARILRGNTPQLGQKSLFPELDDCIAILPNSEAISGEAWNERVKDPQFRNDILEDLIPTVISPAAIKFSRTHPFLDEVDAFGHAMVGADKLLQTFDPSEDPVVGRHVGQNLYFRIVDELRKEGLSRSMIRLYKEIEKARQEAQQEHGYAMQPSNAEVATQRGVSLEQHARDLSLLARGSFAESLDVRWTEDSESLLEQLENPTPYDPTERIAAESEREYLTGRLSPNEAEVLTRYFYDGDKLHEIGERLGVTESRASQIKRRVAERLIDAVQHPFESRQGIRRLADLIEGGEELDCDTDTVHSFIQDPKFFVDWTQISGATKLGAFKRKFYEEHSGIGIEDFQPFQRRCFQEYIRELGWERVDDAKQNAGVAALLGVKNRQFEIARKLHKNGFLEGTPPHYNSLLGTQQSFRAYRIEAVGFVTARSNLREFLRRQGIDDIGNLRFSDALKTITNNLLAHRATDETPQPVNKSVHQLAEALVYLKVLSPVLGRKTTEVALTSPALNRAVAGDATVEANLHHPAVQAAILAKHPTPSTLTDGDRQLAAILGVANRAEAMRRKLCDIGVYPKTFTEGDPIHVGGAIHYKFDPTVVGPSQAVANLSNYFRSHYDGNLDKLDGDSYFGTAAYVLMVSFSELDRATKAERPDVRKATDVARWLISLGVAETAIPETATASDIRIGRHITSFYLREDIVGREAVDQNLQDPRVREVVKSFLPEKLIDLKRVKTLAPVLGADLTLESFAKKVLEHGFYSPVASSDEPLIRGRQVNYRFDAKYVGEDFARANLRARATEQFGGDVENVRKEDISFLTAARHLWNFTAEARGVEPIKTNWKGILKARAALKELGLFPGSEIHR